MLCCLVTFILYIHCMHLLSLCSIGTILLAHFSFSKVRPQVQRLADYCYTLSLTCSSLTQEQCQQERLAHFTNSIRSGRPLSGGLARGSAGSPSGPGGSSGGRGGSPHIQCRIFCTLPLRGGHQRKKNILRGNVVKCNVSDPSTTQAENMLLQIATMMLQPNIISGRHHDSRR